MRTEIVTEYVASDGSRFRSEPACRAYETEYNRVLPILVRIPCNDVPSNRYIQHDRETLLQIKRDLWLLILEKWGDTYPKWRNANADDVHPSSGIGRVMDDYAPASPIASAWLKLCRFNFDLGREYQQPYFAINDNECTEMDHE